MVHQIDSCPGGPVRPPARLITTRKLGCTSNGGCRPNQFHPQIASFPVGSKYRLGGNIDNCTATACGGIGANSGHSSGPNGGLPFWGAWVTEGEGQAARFSGVTVSVVRREILSRFVERSVSLTLATSGLEWLLDCQGRAHGWRAAAQRRAERLLQPSAAWRILPVPACACCGVERRFAAGRSQRAQVRNSDGIWNFDEMLI